VRATLIDGRFRLGGLLGRGGMGAVYRARDDAAGRDVAVKLLPGGQRPERVERFRREGEITASLRHPGIVRLHAAGFAGDRPYLAYELVESARALDAVFAERDLAGRVELVRQAAAALGHAHRAGVVHRDVKPANLLVDPEGRVRVADFGLATAAGYSRLTRTGALMGTPHYMAPEQFGHGRGDVGPATDVWALGVVLYQALTGVLPFEGQSIWEVGAQIANSQITPPSRLARGVPPALEAVCKRALRRSVAERYPDAAAMSADLEAAVAGERLARRPLSRRGLALVGGGLAAAAAAVAAAVALGPGSDADAADAAGSGGPAAPGDSGQSAEPGPGAEPPSPVVTWSVAAGDEAATRFTWRREWTPVGEGRAGHLGLVMDLRERVLDVTDGLATVDARVERLDLDGDEGLRLSYDTAEADDDFLRDVLGRSFTYTFEPATGEVRRLDGLSALRRAVRPPSNAREAALTVVLDCLRDREIERDFAALFAVLPPEGADPGAEGWTRTPVLWAGRDLHVAAEHRIGPEPGGEEGVRLRGAYGAFEPVSVTEGLELRAPTLSGAHEARFAADRLAASRLTLEYEAVTAAHGHQQVRWTIAWERRD